MTILYLSDYRMQIVEGSKSVISKSFETFDTAGCIFNGTISDKEKFVEIVEETFSSKGFSKDNVALILNTNQIISRLMKVPAKKEEGILEYIANDFSDVERTTDPLYSYFTMENDKKVGLSTILAFMIDKKLIEGYQEIFQQCGIKVSTIEPAIPYAIQTLTGLDKVKGKTVITQIGESNGFSTMLFVEGKYTYSTYSRTFNDRDTNEYAMEISRAINNITQFTKAQHIESKIEEVLLSGFTKGEMDTITQLVNEMGQDLTVGTITGQGKAPSDGLSDSITVLGKLQNPVATLDFFKQKKKAEKGPVNLKKRGIIIVSIVLGAMILISAGLIVTKVLMNGKLDKANEFINSSENTQKLEEYNQLVAEKGAYSSRISSIQNLEKTLKTYPLPGTKVNKILEDSAKGLVDVEVVQYQSTTGDFKINCQASKVDKINKFIEILKTKDIFDVKEYSGYEYMDESKTWSVYVVITLDASAGR